MAVSVVICNHILLFIVTNGFVNVVCGRMCSVCIVCMNVCVRVYICTLL